MNNNTEIFELVPCDITQRIIENNTDYIIAIETEGEEYGISINGFEGALMTFADSGCALNAHINTVHQLFIKFAKNFDYELSSVIIEAKYGDVIYCRLKWSSSQGTDIYNICTGGDALVFYMLTLCDLYVTRSVLNQLEKFDSDGFIEAFEV